MLYLALHQHGDVNKHVVQLLDAALKTDDVFVSGLNFAQRLFRNTRVHNLRREGNCYLFISDQCCFTVYNAWIFEN